MEAKSDTTPYGECRCCLKKGKHLDLHKEYNINGQQIISTDVFMDCFNLFLSTDPRLSTQICTVCIQRLQDAQSFRKLVMLNEMHLLEALGDDKHTEFVTVVYEPSPEHDVDIKTEVKSEPSSPCVSEHEEFVYDPLPENDVDIKTEVKSEPSSPCFSEDEECGRDDEATTSFSTGSRGPRGRNAQYYRDYRARKRAEQEKELLNRTSDPSTINVAGSVTSKKRKSAAEYQREYRARKKAKRDNILIDSLAVIPSTAKPTRRKTPAEYQREYRTRKKAQRESKRAANTNNGSMEIADENTSNIGDANARMNPQVPYTQFHQHKKAHNYIRRKFTENNFGSTHSLDVN